MPAYRLIAIALATNGITSLWRAVAVTLAFTALARWIRGVSRSGAAAGAIVCFLLIACVGLGAFAGLITVFALTWVATRFGYRRKQAIGVAERAEGRKASQVSANLGVAAVCALLYWFSHRNSLFLVALVAALSEAAADTVSSELGQAANRQARLITTWKPVPALTTGICVVSGLLPWHYLTTCLGGAVVGMFFDSLLGASLERQGRIGNDTVNFFSTLMAALLAGGGVLVFSK